jgi:hypothetical protein
MVKCSRCRWHLQLAPVETVDILPGAPCRAQYVTLLELLAGHGRHHVRYREPVDAGKNGGGVLLLLGSSKESGEPALGVHGTPSHDALEVLALQRPACHLAAALLAVSPFDGSD